MKYFKRREGVPITDFENVVEQENENGWDLVDFEKGSHRERDLVFRRGSPTFQHVVGNGFIYHERFTMDNTENVVTDVVIETGSKYFFLTSFVLTPNADAISSEILVGATVNDVGTSEADVYNTSQDGNTPTATIYNDPDVESGTGDVLNDSYMPGESGAGQSRRGDYFQSSIKFVLQPNTQYVLQHRNEGGDNAAVLNTEIRWFEMSE